MPPDACTSTRDPSINAKSCGLEKGPTRIVSSLVKCSVCIAPTSIHYTYAWMHSSINNSQQEKAHKSETAKAILQDCTISLCHPHPRKEAFPSHTRTKDETNEVLSRPAKVGHSSNASMASFWKSARSRSTSFTLSELLPPPALLLPLPPAALPPTSALSPGRRGAGGGR